MSDVNPEFSPLIPGINEAFKKIWTYKDMAEFRGNWTTTRANFAPYIPLDGFSTRHLPVPVSDGAEVEIRILRPTNSESERLPLLFVLHGGGWVVGGHDSESSMSRAVCVKNRMVVVSVDYRRAPEHTFPTALNDGYDVFRWIFANAAAYHIDASRTILAGTSAGASLIAALALRLRDDELQDGVLGQILNLPAVCHPDHAPTDRFELNSYEQNANAPTINGQSMRWFWRQYCPDADAGSDPLASPLLAKDHSRLPPALIQVAGLDALRDEGIAYAGVLEAAGVPVELKTYPGLPHGFVLAIKMQVVNDYYKSMVDWIAGRLER
jgi:acetyl esterase/lipase